VRSFHSVGCWGWGEDYYPMPWTSLKYDTNLGGYRVGVTEEQLKGAPKYNRNTEWDWSILSWSDRKAERYRQNSSIKGVPFGLCRPLQALAPVWLLLAIFDVPLATAAGIITLPARC
jgi:hypothetical protein